MTYWVYILASGKHGTLYVGVTNNLGRRMQQHKLGQGSEFVKQHGISMSSRMIPPSMQSSVRKSSSDGDATGRLR